MNVVIITKEQFPFGAAATNRVLSYAPGLVKKGHKVTILCLLLYDDENANLLDNNASCGYEGLTIRYTQGKTMWPVGRNKPLKKLYLAVKAEVNAIRYLVKNRKTIDLVQAYSTKINFYFKYYKWCKLLGIKYVIERSELPDIIKQREKFENSAKGRRYIRRSKRAFELFDGWILETQTLVDYYSRFFKQSTKCVIVPMTVDVDRFNKVKQKKTKYGRYIAYCGNMSEFDGISILIRAYALVRSKFPDVKLVLAGDSTEVPIQKELAKSLGLGEDVLFIGRLSRDEVPQFLADATILALASPTSERACATMPCKVGEYLCTQNPVVVTGLGEINKYLKDGESAFLSRPDSEKAFAEKLQEALSNEERAYDIGKRGREIAIENFSTESQITRIEKFYKDLINS